MPEFSIWMMVVGFGMVAVGLVGGFLRWVRSVEVRLRALEDRR